MVVIARNPVHSVLYLILSFFNAAGIFILLQAEFIAMILVIVYVGAVAVLFLFVVMMLDLGPLQKSKPFLKGFLHLMKSMVSIIGFLTLFIALCLLMMLAINHIFDYWEISIQKMWERILFSTLIGVFVAVCMPKSIYRWLTEVMSDLRQNVSLIVLVGTILFIELGVMLFSFKPFTFHESFSISPISTIQKVNNTKDLGKILYTDYFYLFQISGLILLVAMIGAIVLTYRRRSDVKRQDVSTQMQRKARNTIELKKVMLKKGI